MIRELARAVGQLPDPAFTRVLILSALGTIVLFAGLLTGFGWLLTDTNLFDIGWVETGIDLLGGVAGLALAWLMFPAVMVAVSSTMLDGIVDAVERRHYPHLPPPRHIPVWRSVWEGVKFLGLVVLLNLLALPLYFVPVVNLFVWFLVNGYLIGREYFELVAMRRLGPAGVKFLRDDKRMGLFAAGVIIAFLSSLPLVNLLVPVLAAAFMAHLVEGMRRDIPAAVA
ncbi:EI24 domain-containing protein [Niveispirillum sp.]|uniref:EI24 domain-containing protein n=1 Tax=Niveispirillum sp. TaxID=1917217 RepID=UPI001B4FBE52|nr:EI24 domain-containing protein [Niveispirillum sp.]MBP7335393.1 EI24 domain-containing protein [Niveispirillum sp.]